MSETKKSYLEVGIDISPKNEKGYIIIYFDVGSRNWIITIGIRKRIDSLNLPYDLCTGCILFTKYDVDTAVLTLLMSIEIRRNDVLAVSGQQRLTDVQVV